MAILYKISITVKEILCKTHMKKYVKIGNSLLLLKGVAINIEKIDFLQKKCLTINRKKVYTKYRRNMMFEMRLKALAKINLGLDVLRRREDGYHEVKMVMLRLRKSPGFKIIQQNLRISCCG